MSRPKKLLKPTGGFSGFWKYEGEVTGWSYFAQKLPRDGKTGWLINALTESSVHRDIEVWVTTWPEAYELLQRSEQSNGHELLYAAGRDLEVLTTPEMLFAAYNWTDPRDLDNWTGTVGGWSAAADPGIWIRYEDGEIAETTTETALRADLIEQLKAIGVTDPHRVWRAKA